MDITGPFPTLLPYAAPATPYRRLLLFAIRRMATEGINDAHAAHAILTGFGMSYRRPLVLLRTLMAELSRVSVAQLKIAPCCCPRMTHDEGALLNLIGNAPRNPDAVHTGMTQLLNLQSCLGVVCSAEAVATAFADLGMPLTE